MFNSEQPVGGTRPGGCGAELEPESLALPVCCTVVPHLDAFVHLIPLVVMLSLHVFVALWCLVFLAARNVAVCHH